jgi:hypothetical protein
VVFGVIAIAMGVSGVQTVHDNLAQENIVGRAGLHRPRAEGEHGRRGRAFADVMRKHTLEATEGQTYAEMGRWLDSSRNPTSDENAAAVNEKGQPVENPLRQLWVTETALATAPDGARTSAGRRSHGPAPRLGMSGITQACPTSPRAR